MIIIREAPQWPSDKTLQETGRKTEGGGLRWAPRELRSEDMGGSDAHESGPRDRSRDRERIALDLILKIAVSVLAIAAIVLEVLDVLSTYHMLARGGHEQNPIVVWFMHVLGDAWPVCKLPEIALIFILWAFAPRPIAFICLGLAVAGYSFVVWHNYHI
jgi:hypothetical protein